MFTYLILVGMIILLLAAGAVWFIRWFKEERKRYLILTTKRLAGNATQEEMQWWFRVNKHRYVSLKEWTKYQYRYIKYRVILFFRNIKNRIVAAYKSILPKKEEEPISKPMMYDSLEDAKKHESYIAKEYVNIAGFLANDLVCDEDDDPYKSYGEKTICHPFSDKKKPEVVLEMEKSNGQPV